jgi:hypothetical protein
MQGFRVLEIPDTPIPDMPMGPTADGFLMVATCPCRWTVLIDSRGFGTYDVLNSLSSGTPISRSATFVRSLTPVPCERTAQISSGNRGSRFPVAQFLYPRKLRCPDSLGSHAMRPRRWTVQIRSGNRVSRFQPAQVSRLRKPRFTTLRDLLTPVPCLDGSDPIEKSRIAISLCNGSTLLKSPMVKSRRLPEH